MTPDSEISEEAVKAAFAWVHVNEPGTDVLDAVFDSAEQDINAHRQRGETGMGCTARILAAHARALQAIIDNPIPVETHHFSEGTWGGFHRETGVTAIGVTREDAIRGVEEMVLGNKTAQKVRDLMKERDAWRGVAERMGDAMTCVLKSATPNERDHPTMHAAWMGGRQALSELAKLKGEQQ